MHKIPKGIQVALISTLALTLNLVAGAPALASETVDGNPCRDRQCEITPAALRLPSIQIETAFSSASIFQTFSLGFATHVGRLRFSMADQGRLKFYEHAHAMTTTKSMSILLTGPERANAADLSLTRPDGTVVSVSCLSQPADECRLDTELIWQNTIPGAEVDFEHVSVPGKYSVKVSYTLTPSRSLTFWADAP